MKCGIKDCPNDAGWQVGFKVWARGYPKTSTPLKGLIGLAVCDEHRNIEAATFFLPETIARFNQRIVALGKAEADFKNAEMTYEPLIDGKMQAIR